MPGRVQARPARAAALHPAVSLPGPGGLPGQLTRRVPDVRLVGLVPVLGLLRPRLDLHPPVGGAAPGPGRQVQCSRLCRDHVVLQAVPGQADTEEEVQAGGLQQLDRALAAEPGQLRHAAHRVLGRIYLLEHCSKTYKDLMK